ncbi:hypothetical protein [Rufibacter immobilis]|nr:hypothetical protein [Rufibacter immobilis]
MKTLALIIVFILSYSLTASADSFSIENKGLKMEMRRLYAELKLSETQFVKLKGLERERLRELEEVQNVVSGTRLEILHTQINSWYEDAVLQRLTPVQQKKYLICKGSFRRK